MTTSSHTVWMVTGASRGIGHAIATAALRAGHAVVATARRPQQLAAALDAAGGSDRLLVLPLDLTKDGDAAPVVEAVKSRFGRIDVLVNNAGYGQIGWFENTSPQQVRQQFETNVFGTMELTRAVLPLMREQRSGHVFTFSSIAGLLAFPGSSVYSASKFALEGWMESLAQELRPLGIAATLVEPGFFRTDFLESTSVSYGEYDMQDYAEASAAFRTWHDEQNHNQLGDPAKLAAALLQLAGSEKAPLRYIAGSDALELILKKAESLKAEALSMSALSRSTDIA